LPFAEGTMTNAAVYVVVAVLCTVVPTGEAEATMKRAPVAPTEIIAGTTELLYDLYAAGYDAGYNAAAKAGVPELYKTHVSKHIPADPVEVACSKIGCKKTEVMQKYKQAEGAVLQVKAQAYEYSAKAHEMINVHAHSAGIYLEKLLPSYAGQIPKTAADLILLSLYLLFVAWVVFKIFMFVSCMFLSIFCCVCCCCCRRKKGAASPKNSGKNGKKDNTAAAQKGKAAAKADPKAKSKK